MSYYKIEKSRAILKHYNKSVREPKNFCKLQKRILLGISNGTKSLILIQLEADIKMFTEAKI
jgi:hypothetical protein